MDNDNNNYEKRDSSVGGYRNRLFELVAQQIQTFIKGVMRPEDIVNGNRTNGQYEGTGRIHEIQKLEPRYQTSDISDGNSLLFPTETQMA